MIDVVVDRRELKGTIAACLPLHAVAAPRTAATAVPAAASRAGDRRRSLRGRSVAWLSSPRTLRHQARAREHRGALRGARTSRARVAVRAHRRHQRQGIGGRDGRRARCSAAGHSTGRYTSPHLVRLEERIVIDGAESPTRRARRVARTRARRRGDAVEDAARSRRTHVLRGDDRGGVRAVPHGRRRDRRHRGRARRPFRRDERRCSRSRPRLRRSISITRRISARRSRQIAFEKAGIIKPGVPAVVGPMAGRGAARGGTRRARAGGAADRRAAGSSSHDVRARH